MGIYDPDPDERAATATQIIDGLVGAVPKVVPIQARAAISIAAKFTKIVIEKAGSSIVDDARLTDKTVAGAATDVIPQVDVRVAAHSHEVLRAQNGADTSIKIPFAFHGPTFLTYGGPVRLSFEATLRPHVELYIEVSENR